MTNLEKEIKMQKMFKNVFTVFMTKLANANNIDLAELVKKSNEDSELRKEIQNLFLKTLPKN
jgi:hypothetical protein|tara:strand:- start:922 stop:1107 length:186 start_codon:yes stop_codon:yes gene_type:complete